VLTYQLLTQIAPLGAEKDKDKTAPPRESNSDAARQSVTGDDGSAARLSVQSSQSSTRRDSMAVSRDSKNLRKSNAFSSTSKQKSNVQEELRVSPKVFIANTDYEHEVPDSSHQTKTRTDYRLR
jgi:hypothetical protein